MGPDTRAAGMTNAIAAGTLAGLSLACADVMLVPIAADTAPIGLPFLTGLTLLVGVGALTGLAALLPHVLIFAALAAVGFMMGIELTRGAFAASLPFAPLWKFILAGGFFLGSRWLAGRSRFSSSLALLSVVAMTLGVALVERGRYMGLRLTICPLSIGGMMFVLLPLMARLQMKARKALIVMGVLSVASTFFIAVPSQQVVDATEKAGSHAVAPMLYLRAKFSTSAPDADDVDLNDAAFFGTELSSASLQLFADVEGVLLITIDAWRTDMINRSVGGRPVTPTLDKLAESGTVFTRNYAACTSSHLSLLSLFSGVLPAAAASRRSENGRIDLITEILQASGIETRSCFPQAVHTVRNRDAVFTQHELGFAHTTGHAFDDPEDSAIIRALLPTGGGRFFSYCHLMRPHKPYGDAPESFHSGDSPFEKYAADVRAADASVAAIVGAFEEKGLLAKTLVIISSDHGEEFGEHGGSAHGSRLFDETARVPMVAFGPGVERAIHKGITSLVDLAPTLSHLFLDQDIHRNQYAGRSLLPILGGLDDKGRPDRAFGEILPTLSFASDSLAMVVEGKWKLLLDQSTNRSYLFDLQSDPGEKQNVYDDHPVIASRLAGLIHARRKKDRSTAAAVTDDRVDAVAGLESQSLETVIQLFGAQDQELTDLIAFSLCYLTADLSPEQARAVLQLVASTDDPVLRTAILNVRVGAGIADSNEVAEWLKAVQATSDPFIQIAAYRAGRATQRSELMEAPLPPPDAHADVVALARMGYERVMGRGRLHPLSIRTALRHKNAYVRRLALEAVESSGDESYLDDLRRTAPFFHEVRYRAALDRAHDAIKSR